MADWYLPLVAPLFPSVQWRSGSADLWLTFDDGPHPVATPAVLDTLNREHVKAVFFLLGLQAERHPEIVRRIVAEGHVVGNHGDEHRAMWFRSRSEVVRRLRRASETIERSGGGRPSLFRPPYGRLDPSTPVHARAAGLRTMMFTVNSWDFAGGSVASIADRVGRRSRPGDIILLHDNDRTAAVAGNLTGEIIRQIRMAGRTIGKPIA